MQKVVRKTSITDTLRTFCIDEYRVFTYEEMPTETSVISSILSKLKKTGVIDPNSKWSIHPLPQRRVIISRFS